MWASDADGLNGPCRASTCQEGVDVPTPATPYELVATELSLRTHCPYCAFQCGVNMPENPSGPGWLVSGDPHFPVNNGQLCIKGWTSGSLLIHPSRLTTPMLRNASGRLVPVTWEDALDFVADGFRNLRERHGA